MWEIIIKNQFIKIEEKREYREKIFHYFEMMKSVHGHRFQHELLTHERFYYSSVEAVIEDVVKKIKRYTTALKKENNIDCPFSEEEIAEQLSSDDCSKLYSWLQSINYFNGYTNLVVDSKMSVKELKEIAKKIYLKNISKLKKKELIDKINDYRLAVLE